MPVRKISNKGTKKIIGKFPSLKMGKTVWWESQLEQDYIYLLEFDPDVTSYQEQPQTISYTLNGKKRRYTPDFFVHRGCKRQIIEVKPEDQITKEKNVLLFNSVAPIFNREGYEFTLVTEKAIRVQPRLANIKLLTRYARTPIDPQLQITCHEFFIGKHEARLSDVARSLAANNLEMHLVYSLLYWGILSFDLMEPIEANSYVRPSHGF
jgi:TnsA endonuclease N terminal